MTGTNEFSQFERVVQKIYPQSRLLRAWNLTGGVSAQVIALEFALPDGQTKKAVVRRYGQGDLSGDPQIAAHEFKLLQTIQAAGVPVPGPLYFDQSGLIFPTPFIVIEFVEGKTNFEPANMAEIMGQMVNRLVEIHRIDPVKNDLGFLPHLEQQIAAKLAQKPARLDDSLEEGRIRSALERVWPLPPSNPPGLLHGDCWPGNLLWQGEQLAAVIDWEDAKLGDPLADLGNSRMEFLWTFGIEGMETFTRYYQCLMPLDYTNLPYWDLCAALRPAGQIAIWAGDSVTEQRMRERHKLFVAEAFERIGHL